MGLGPFFPLLTDVFLYLLLIVVIVFFLYVRRQPHLLAPWRRVLQSRMGVFSLIILGLFVGIGLLDSLHFRTALPAKQGANPKYSAEVLSALDMIAKPLKQQTEKTYSAPFDLYLFAKEAIDKGDGKEVYDYPRLKFGGAHLNDLTQRNADITQRTLSAIAMAILLWLIFSAIVVAILAKRYQLTFTEASRRIWRDQFSIPWNVALITIGIIFLIAVPAIALSTKYHIFGTDKVGQDVFYLALKSIRTALVIGSLTTLVMLPFALLLGIMAGYLRGWVDDVIQYIYTTLSSIPSVLLIAAAVLMAQVYMETHQDLFATLDRRADFRLLFLCLILGITSWTVLCRLLRGETLKLREMEYIQAAQAFGVSRWRIMTRHILPNVMHIVLITVVMDFSGLVLAEAVLSYVGVGVDPSMISFGTMINNARFEMAREPMVWWSLAAAFAFMFVFVLCANLFADVVRDAFDPRVSMNTRAAKLISKTSNA